MEKSIILNDLKETFDPLKSLVSTFDDDAFNQVPFAGSWTAAQVVEHIILSSSGFAEIINGHVEDTSRPINERIPLLKSIFLDFSTKMQSPDFVLPEIKHYDRDAQLARVIKSYHALQAAASDLDLSKTCVAFELPEIGFLTRLEGIYFVVYHTKRHLHQLIGIQQLLKLSQITL